MMRNHTATIRLVDSGYPSEAAILCLTQFELLLDLWYMEGHTSRATKWLEHSSDKEHVWKVGNKINGYFRDNSSGKQASHALHRLLCTIKHENPSAGKLGFDLKRVGNSVHIGGWEDDDSKLDISRFVLDLSSYVLALCTVAAMRALGRFFAIHKNLQSEVIGIRDRTHVTYQNTMKSISLRPLTGYSVASGFMSHQA